MKKPLMMMACLLSFSTAFTFTAGEASADVFVSVGDGHRGGHHGRHHGRNYGNYYHAPRGHAYGHYKHRRYRDYGHRYEYPRYHHNRVIVTPTRYSYSEPVSNVYCEDRVNPVPAVLGGAAGGVIGSKIGKGSGRTAAIIGGALIGGVLGSQYTTRDRYCTREVFETVSVGSPARWYGDDYNYTVTPTRNYETAGRYCREYQAVATIGNRTQETYGTACRQPDGSWEIIN